MTDHPRFERMLHPSGDAHRHCHGGRVVDFVFGVVERRALRRLTSQAPHSLKFEIGAPIALVLLLGMVLASIGTVHSQKSQEGAGQELMIGASAGPDASPDEEVANMRRPQAPFPYAFYTP